MTTISNLYQQLKEGVITRENFMRRVRNEYSHMVSPTNSFDDAIRILKNKGVLTEAHQLSTEQIIDRLNPYAVKKGIEVEIAKCKGEINLQKIKERVAKNLSKNQKYYEADQYANAKIVDKHDSKQEMRPVKKELVDKDNAMRKPKGYSPDKANTKASKKENRKGKPKGVKLMKENDGGQLPQQVDYTGQDITVSVDPNTKKPLSQPKPGKVVRQHGNILFVDFGDGQETPITISVVDGAQQEPQLSKSELDKSWSDWDKTGQGRISAMEEGKPSYLTRVSVSLNDADSITHNGQPLDWERLTDEDDRDYREEIMRYGVVEYNGNEYEIDYIDDPSNYSQNQDGEEYGDGPQIHLIPAESVEEDLKSSSLKGWSSNQSSNLDKWMNRGKDKKDDKKSDKPEKMSDIVSKLKEYLSKKKALKRGIKEEEDTGVVRISKNDPKKAEKIKKVKARGGTYEIYDPNSQ